MVSCRNIRAMHITILVEKHIVQGTTTTKKEEEKNRRRENANSGTAEKGVRKHEHFGAIICISHVPTWKVPKKYIMDSRAVLTAYEAKNAKLSREFSHIFRLWAEKFFFARSAGLKHEARARKMKQQKRWWRRRKKKWSLVLHFAGGNVLCAKYRVAVDAYSTRFRYSLFTLHQKLYSFHEHEIFIVVAASKNEYQKCDVLSLCARDRWACSLVYVLVDAVRFGAISVVVVERTTTPEKF